LLAAPSHSGQPSARVRPVAVEHGHGRPAFPRRRTAPGPPTGRRAASVGAAVDGAGDAAVPGPRIPREHGRPEWIYLDWIVPVTAPKPIRVPPWPGAVAVSTTVSPSARKVRVEPSARCSGSVPFQVSSISEPRWRGSGPETVPEAYRSPVRRLAPLLVRWASCWAGVQ